MTLLELKNKSTLMNVFIILTIRSSSYFHVIYICKNSSPNYTHSNSANYFFPLVCIPFDVLVIQIAFLFYSTPLHNLKFLKACKLTLDVFMLVAFSKKIMNDV